MSDLKKIAADPERKFYTAKEIIDAIAKWDAIIGLWLPNLLKSHRPTMRDLRNFITDVSWHLADTLDALAAQEPAIVAACCGRTECGGECGNEWRGMQPAPPQPAVSEEFEHALSVYGAERYADGAHDCDYNESTEKARAEVLRLYALALAAPQRPTVSREVLVAAYAELFNNDDPSALRALGIEVQG